MLTLSESLRLDRFTVYRDVVVAEGQRSYSSRFYVLPDAPRLATDDTGRPEFDFVWYRQPAGAAAVAAGAGGIVTITVELGPSGAERAALAAAIRAALPAEPLPSIEIMPVPFVDGTVELTFAGERAGELATTAGPVPARLQGSQRATFIVELSRDGAGLLRQAVDAGHDLFHARYELTFSHRLDGVDLRVWCDGRRAHEVAVAATQTGNSDLESLTSTLVDQHAAGVELVARRQLPDEYRAALDALGQRLITATLAATLFEPSADGAARSVRPYSAATEATLNHTFTQSQPVLQHAVLQDVLRLGHTVEQLGDRVRTVELGRGFFAVLEVSVLCTVDFTIGHIEVVHVVVEYDAMGGAGRVHRTGEFIFRDGTGPQTFRTELAAPESRAVRWHALVHYRGDPVPVIVDQPPVETTVIVLDLDGSGVLEVSAELRDVPFDSVTGATVELQHPSTGHTGTLVLDAANPADTWTVVVRERPQPVRYRVTWHGTDGRSSVQEWAPAPARSLWLDAPAALRRGPAVELVAAGDFSALAQLVVELRSADGAPVESFAFTAAGQGAVWSSTGVDPARLRYQSRQVLVYADGSRDELDWVDRDAPVLVVGDLLRFEVLVEPRLLDLGGGLRLALLELAPGADGADGQSETLVLRDRTVPQRWSFRMSEPGSHDYRYQLTLVPSGGDRIVVAWRTARDGILVLRHPET